MMSKLHSLVCATPWAGLALLALGLPAVALGAQRVTSSVPDFPMLGSIKPRAASEIKASTWSIGGETLDRDFAVYANYRHHLGPLGAKHIRLQAGWAKCEKQRGVYSWQWLDEIINDALAQGVQPWVELSYGNPVYPGGGDTGLGGGFPSSPEALAAWDRWARALVERYRDRVREWEIWNEPDINQAGTAPVSAYVDLFIRTAGMIREVQPSAVILALALAGNLNYADQFLAGLHAKGRLDLVDALTIHGYPRNPDDTSNLQRLQAVIAQYDRPIPIRQGETGAPSKYQEYFALSKIPWSENTQAKWNLRRMLAHRALDMPFNLFSMSDLHYHQYHRANDGALRMNYKGLLGTNPDQTISHVKLAYHAAQHVFTIFDDTVARLTEFPHTATVTNRLAVSAYVHRPSGGQMVALWFSQEPPRESNQTTPVDVTFPRGTFREPVYADLRTGQVHGIPKAHWERGTEGTVFRQIPVYDSPVLIAEKTALDLETSAPGSGARPSP